MKILFGDAFLEPVNVTEGKRLYSGLKSYTFRVDANPARLAERPGSVRLVLDPGSTSVSLLWEGPGAPDQFTEEDDPNDYVRIEGRSDVEDDPANNTYWVDFKIMFDWSWPHEEMCDAIVNPLWPPAHDEHEYLSESLFSVENDLMFVGPHEVRGDAQGPLVDGDWVRAGENVTVSGPKVVYEGTGDISPPSGTCNVSLIDDDSDHNVSPMVSHQAVKVTLQVDDVTDAHETLTLTLRDLPKGAGIVNNRTVSIRVDGDVPKFIQVVPGTEDWSSTSDVIVSVTCSDTNTSGVDGATLQYSISTDGMMSYSEWSTEGLIIDAIPEDLVGRVEVHLPDGEDNHIRWRVRDNVENPYAVSPGYRLLVDTQNVTYSDPIPEHDTWSNRSIVECGITIEDREGAGIDSSTIQFRLSPLTVSQYGDWIDWDEGDQADAEVIVVRIDVEFPGASINFLQWRAIDLAGNGYTTSPHYKISIDELEISFEDFDPTDDAIQNEADVTCWIEVSDAPLGSGVNMSSIEYRHSLVGGGYSEWLHAGMDGILTENRFSVVVRLPDGLDNSVQFRGFDAAGNGPTLSDEYQVLVDTTGPRFIDLAPSAEDKQMGPEVRVVIHVTDDTTAVHPARL